MTFTLDVSEDDHIMPKQAPNVEVRFPPKLHPETGDSLLFAPARYRVFYGGRGGGKSHAVANSLIVRATQKPLRILCAREFQSSINQSVWQLLCDCIERQKLQGFFTIERDKIKGANGSQFSFQGIRQNISSIKSFEGTDVCWVEEAANVTDHSWSILIPTIRRKAGSEIIVTFNPEYEDDATYQRFVVHPPAGATIAKINWYENPFLGPDLKVEIEELRLSDPDSYRHVYEGECRKYLDGAVYKNELRQAYEDDRIDTVPYAPQCSVETFWDIGIQDATAIWVAQRVGQEYHLIDYLEDSGKPVTWFLMQLNDKKRFPFVIDKIWLPHDATAREKGSGVSIEELIRNKGYRVGVVPKLQISDGINAVREMFPLMWFDKLKCSAGLVALRSYAYEIRKDGFTFHNEPAHSKYSHAADALRYMAVALKPPKVRADLKYTKAWDRFTNSAGTSWMNI